MIYPMKLLMSLVSCALCPGALTAGALTAQDTTARNPHAVQPERPTVATHAGTVARGWVELEEGAEWDKLQDGSHAFVAPTNLKIGLAPRAQANILFNLLHTGPNGSLEVGDLTLGIKYRIIDGDRILGDFAILPAVKLPTGTSAATTGTTDFSLLLISSREVGPVAVDLNVGQTRRTGNGNDAPKTSGLWTASFGFPVAGPLGGVLEFFGYQRTTGPVGADAIVAMLAGPTFLAHEWLSVDAGVIVPITGPQARAFYTGFVWNIGCFAGKRVCGRTESR